MTRFKPWIHHYNVRLDASFKQAFVVASAQDSDTKSLSINSGGLANTNTSSVFATVPLLDTPLPHLIDVQKRGLQDKAHEGSKELSIWASSVSIMSFALRLGLLRLGP